MRLSFTEPAKSLHATIRFIAIVLNSSPLLLARSRRTEGKSYACHRRSREKGIAAFASSRHRCLSLKEEEVRAEELLRRAYQHRLPPLSLLSLTEQQKDLGHGPHPGRDPAL
nr:hypothetical protein Iba_chr02eCG8020 [Ipomoea batatas]